MSDPIVLSPFANESESVLIGPDSGLTFENGLDKITVYGDTSFTPDQQGLDDVQTLREVLSKIEIAIQLKLSNVLNGPG